MSAITTIEFALPSPPETDDNAILARHWHHAANQCAEGALEAAARCGDVLAEQRDILAQDRKRGGSRFSAWVKENCPFSNRTANRYITIAVNWDKLRHACQSSDEPLSLNQALRRIDEWEIAEANIDSTKGAVNLRAMNERVFKPFEKVKSRLLQSLDDVMPLAVGFHRFDLAGRLRDAADQLAPEAKPAPPKPTPALEVVEDDAPGWRMAIDFWKSRKMLTKAGPYKELLKLGDIVDALKAAMDCGDLDKATVDAAINKHVLLLAQARDAEAES